MFVTNSLYDPVIKDITGDDIKFWKASLDIAILNTQKLNDKNVDIKSFKMNTPAYFCSQMYADDTIAFTRKQYNRRLKDQRRKSIVLDLDCDSKEEFELYRNKMISFANTHNYYLCVYPTISFPEKPHFRAIYFCSRGLNPMNYAKAVSWLYNELDMIVTDFSDFDIRASRNLPVFINNQQVNAIYSNLSEDCDKIDNKVWKNFEIDKELKEKINNRLKNSQKAPEKLQYSGYYYKKDELIRAWGDFVYNNKEKYMSYDNVWKVLSSIAKAYSSGEINWKTVEKLSLILATIDKEKWHTWQKGNLELIRKFCNQDNLNDAKDLMQYSTKILTTLRVDNKDNKDNSDNNEGDK